MDINVLNTRHLTLVFLPSEALQVCCFHLVPKDREGCGSSCSPEKNTNYLIYYYYKSFSASVFTLAIGVINLNAI